MKNGQSIINLLSENAIVNNMPALTLHPNFVSIFKILYSPAKRRNRDKIGGHPDILL